MKPFRHILSLGSACQATVQLRANFPTLKAGPFDWWVTPFERMVAFLDATDWSLFEAGDLEPVQDRVSIARLPTGPAMPKPGAPCSRVTM